VDELIEQELNFDLDYEELEVLSDSEIQDDTRYLLEENHFEICQTHQKHLKKELRSLNQSMKEMSTTMGSNLNLITDYIKKMQNNEQIDENSIEIK